MKPPLVLLVAASFLAAAGCHRGGGADDDASDDAAKATVSVRLGRSTRGDVRSVVAVTGTLAPLPDREAKIAPLAPGRILRVFVKTGDAVRKGEVVATLDPGGTPGQIQQAQAAVRVAEATLSQARYDYAAQLRTQRASVDQAALNVEVQRVALAKLRAGSRPQEIVQARANLASAQASLTTAEQSLSRSQTLFGEGLIARKDLEAAQEQEKTSRAAVTNAQQALSLAQQGNRPEDVRAGEVALAQARQQLDAARAQSVQNGAKLQDVRVAEGQVASAQGALRAAAAQAKALSIVSPVSGTVVGRTVNAGESVDVATAVATVVDLTRVRVLLNVPAEQAQAVAPGQTVRFTADASPSVERTATVTVVNRSVDPATNTVQVEAVADNPDRSLRDDGFVKANIVTVVHRNAVLVPAAAVVDKDGKTTVFVAGADGAAHAKEVQVGIQSGGGVEIRSGLDAGEKVVTTGAYELDDGTKIKVGE